jgi:hypothetical protein
VVRLITYAAGTLLRGAAADVFLAGDVWSVIVPNTLVLAAMAARWRSAAAPSCARAWTERAYARLAASHPRLTRKELLAVLKDPRSRMSLLVPPVVQALIFGYAATYDLNHVHLRGAGSGS